VQRDTGGYAVALAASMEQVYCGKPGETFFCGQRHRLGRGPQLHRLRPAAHRHDDHHLRGPAHPPRRRHLVVAGREVQGQCDVLGAHRHPRPQEADPDCLKRHDLSSLKQLFLAGEPLDEPTAKWIGDAIGKPIIDNYWQTETGWPILSLARGVDPTLTNRAWARRGSRCPATRSSCWTTRPARN
jgi:propionyl-CoA synthetase